MLLTNEALADVESLVGGGGGEPAGIKQQATQQKFNIDFVVVVVIFVFIIVIVVPVLVVVVADVESLMEG